MGSMGFIERVAPKPGRRGWWLWLWTRDLVSDTEPARRFKMLPFLAKALGHLNSGGRLLKKSLMTALAAAAVLALGAATPMAQGNIVVHFSGYGYEMGGFEFSDPGDEIHLISRVTSIDAPGALPYFPADNEYTLVVTGLVSNGEIVNSGVSTIVYNLGSFAIYEDAAFNSDWNEFPSIPTPPPSFFDGNAWLSGPFTDFAMTLWRDLGMGVFEGHISLTGGSAIAYFTEEAYTFGGTLVPPHNPGIPAGYELSLDGEVWVEYIATNTSSLSQIKALY